jgi:hypothetical protein
VLDKTALDEVTGRIDFTRCGSVPFREYGEGPLGPGRVFVVCEWVGRHRGHRVRAGQYLLAATIGWFGRCVLAQRFEIRGESVIAKGYG